MKRYNVNVDELTLSEHPDGEWVRWDDIEYLDAEAVRIAYQKGRRDEWDRWARVDAVTPGVSGQSIACVDVPGGRLSWRADGVEDVKDDNGDGSGYAGDRQQ